MVTGDASFIKQINRSIIIGEIVKEGFISRADLSKATELTRATISAQVADLIDDGLVVETHVEHNAVGRKPIMLSINRKVGYALGIDLDYGQVTFMLSDLLGSPVSSHTVELHTTDYSEILSILVEEIKKLKHTFTDTDHGIIGIVIAIHGLVGKDETIHFVPRFKWKNIHLKVDLEKEIGITVHLENNANLSSFAERAYIHHETNNLLCTTHYSGIGLGMMMNNEFFRGHNGFAGEIGHMIIVPEGITCNCGNKGCWEKYASESSFFAHLSELKNEQMTYEQVEQLLAQGDEEVQQLMDKFIYYISIGLNNLINMYNPEVIVLDSELLRIYPNALEKITANLHSSISHYHSLSISTIGRRSSVLGACALAIKHFLNVPTLNLPVEQK